jgi:hypothetical protein
MTELSNGDQRRRSFSWLGILTILYTFSLLGWPIALVIVGMASSDYVGPSTPHIPGDVIPVLLAWAYPFVVIIGLVVAWVLHHRQLYRAANWVSLIPLANILLGFLALAVLQQAIINGRNSHCAELLC